MHSYNFKYVLLKPFEIPCTSGSHMLMSVEFHEILTCDCIPTYFVQVF